MSTTAQNPAEASTSPCGDGQAGQPPASTSPTTELAEKIYLQEAELEDRSRTLHLINDARDWSLTKDRLDRAEAQEKAVPAYDLEPRGWADTNRRRVFDLGERLVQLAKKTGSIAHQVDTLEENEATAGGLATELGHIGLETEEVYHLIGVLKHARRQQLALEYARKRKREGGRAAAVPPKSVKEEVSADYIVNALEDLAGRLFDDFMHIEGLTSRVERLEG